MFWFILYNGVLLPGLTCIVFLTAIFSPKMREGLKGRFQTYRRLKLFFEKKHTPPLTPRGFLSRNNEIPWNGKDFGNLKVRGPFIASEYMKGDGGEILDEDGFFDTGDVATIDEMGFMQITDRSKDVIKSGGEWISSIELENVAVGHPDIAEAAVIGVVHPKWDERPLLICVASEGTSPSGKDVLDFLDGKLAKWWMPDDVVFVDEIPHTATGKIQKLTLRDQFKDYVLPSLK